MYNAIPATWTKPALRTNCRVGPGKSPHSLSASGQVCPFSAQVSATKYNEV
jgi:hypothetical protein